MGPEQPDQELDLVIGNPTHGRGLKLGKLWSPSQAKPFCDSTT